jgi:DNA repair photolyase
MSISEMVRQDETWLTIDGVVGCKMNCKYCFLQLYGQTPRAGEVIANPNDLIGTMLDFPTYHEDAYIMIGSETDIFMHPRNVQYLQETIGSFVQRGIPNKICLVTKNAVPASFISFLESHNLKDKVIFYFSYSGLPKEIEPAIDIEKLKESIVELNAKEYTCIHYWRPLLPQNTTPEVVNSVCSFVSQYCKCSVVLGLKYNEQIVTNTSPYWPDLEIAKKFGSIGQIYPAHATTLIYETFKKYNKSYPIFSTNSCALSYVSSVNDFAGFYGSQECQNNQCPAEQRSICKSKFKIPTEDDVRRVCAQIGVSGKFRIDEKGLVFDKELEHGQIIFIRHRLNFPVSARNVVSENEWGGAAIDRKDLFLSQFKMSDFIKISLEIKDKFRKIEKQTWTNSEFIKELIVQLGHLFDITLRQTHKLNHLTEEQNAVTIADEICDIMLNVVSLLYELGKIDILVQVGTINSLVSSNHQNLDIDSCLYGILKNIHLISESIDSTAETIVTPAKETLSYCIYLSYLFNVDIESAYIKMREDSFVFINKHSEYGE